MNIKAECSVKVNVRARGIEGLCYLRGLDVEMRVVDRIFVIARSEYIWTLDNLLSLMTW